MSKPKAQVAIDLETLGKKADSIILSIGVVAICEQTGDVRKFYGACSVASQPERTSVQSTLDWWSKQSADARKAFDFAHGPDCPSLTETLNRLTEWIGQIGETHDVYVWGNGANFDLAMLEHAYQGLSDFVPWYFRNTRDMRTLYDITLRFGLDIRSKVPRVGTHHHALADAEWQAKVVIESLRQLTILAAFISESDAFQAELDARAELDNGGAA